jgi:uncharacterized protein
VTAATGPAGMVIERDIPIPMADGVALAADIYRPAGGPPVPVIMSMGPYGKGIHFRDNHRAEWDRLIAEHPEVLDGSSGEHMVWELADPERWVPHGYAVVRVDSRGAGRSPGYLDCLSPRETADFCQAIEWAAAQPWSTGKVGLCGVSYYAMTQWLAAARQPPHLAAIIVWEGAHDFYRDVTHHGGVLSSVFPRLWYERRVVGNQHGQGERGLADRGAGGLAAGPETLPEEALQARRADLVTALREHHLDDAFHRSRTADLSRVTVPLLSAANWAGFGLHARGNFTGFTGAASAHKWLQVHGGRHEEWFYLPQSITLQRRFFDCFLKGIDNGWRAEPRVQLHIRRPGERFEHRNEQHWPLARTRWTDLYLDAAGRGLRWEPPGPPGAVTFAALGPGVTFRSAPLPAETEITGPLAATLYVATSTTDADLFVTLQAFLPGGNEVVFDGASDPAAPLAQGCLRLSHRRTDPDRSAPWQPFHPHDTAEPARPGQTYRVDIELWPTCIVLPPGATLALTVTGRDFARGISHATTDPRQLIGRGSGTFLHCDPADRPAPAFTGHTTLHTGGRTLARLILPVIPAGTADPGSLGGRTDIGQAHYRCR